MGEEHPRQRSPAAAAPAPADGIDLEARCSELERRLAESEGTRETLAEALAETMRYVESSEREWSDRLQAAEAARARADQELAALAARLAEAPPTEPGVGTRELERRRALEVQRHKEVLVDLERRLEASARAEAQARRRIAELEKERADRTLQTGRVAALEEALARARKELEGLRSKNQQLAADVARHERANVELRARLGK